MKNIKTDRGRFKDVDKNAKQQQYGAKHIFVL